MRCRRPTSSPFCTGAARASGSSYLYWMLVRSRPLGIRAIKVSEVARGIWSVTEENRTGTSSMISPFSITVRTAKLSKAHWSRSLASV